MTSHPEPIDADFDASTRERLFVSVAEERIDKIQTLIINNNIIILLTMIVRNYYI